MKTLIKARTKQQRFLLNLRMGFVTVITHIMKTSIDISIQNIEKISSDTILFSKRLFAVAWSHS